MAPKFMCTSPLMPKSMSEIINMFASNRLDNTHRWDHCQVGHRVVCVCRVESVHRECQRNCRSGLSWGRCVKAHLTVERFVASNMEPDGKNDKLLWSQLLYTHPFSQPLILARVLGVLEPIPTILGQYYVAGWPATEQRPYPTKNISSPCCYVSCSF